MLRILQAWRRKSQKVLLQSPVMITMYAVLFLTVIAVVHNSGYRTSNEAFIYSPRLRSYNNMKENENRIINYDDAIQMQSYNNETGADHFIVPNIIHFVRFNLSEYSFVDYVVMQAAMRNHRPDHFYIHSDTPNNFTGKYWEMIKKDRELWSRIRILPLRLPTEVFGQKLSEDWQLFHGSDVERIRIMMKYGGIYLDNDVYVVKNLDKYRRFEMVMGWSEGGYLDNQVIICSKNAAFLTPWLETYRVYREEDWYYNGGVRPVKEILEHRPELMHRVKGWFGTDSNMVREIYESEEFEDWRRFDTIHLLVGHRHYLDRNYNSTPEFDEENIKKYRYPVGQMFREVLDESSGITAITIV